MPKAPTLDPLENFRVNRRLRHLRRIMKFIGRCYTKTFKNHCKINEKSMKKRTDFWIDLLIDFFIVFGRVLGAILGPKIDEKCIQKLSNFLMAF